MTGPDNKEQPIRFVSYLRVSTKRQGKYGVGLLAQRSAVAQFIDGGKLLKEYIEVESGQNNNRRLLANAITLSKRNNATLVVAKLDRLARNAKFLLEIVESGVEVAFCDFPQIPKGPVGKLMLNFMAALAEFESGIISQRVKASYQARMERDGFVRCAQNDKRKAEALQKAQKYRGIFVRMLKQRVGGQKYMALYLNDLGIESPTGHKWNRTSVQKTMERLNQIEKLPKQKKRKVRKKRAPRPVPSVRRAAASDARIASEVGSVPGSGVHVAENRPSAAS